MQPRQHHAIESLNVSNTNDVGVSSHVLLTRRGPRPRGERCVHGPEGSSLHREPGSLQPPQLHDLLLRRGESD